MSIYIPKQLNVKKTTGCVVNLLIFLKNLVIKRPMIRCKLLHLMSDKGIRYINTLSKETGINRKTLTYLAENKIKRYDADVIGRLCKYFGCTIGDILEYVDD